MYKKILAVVMLVALVVSGSALAGCATGDGGEVTPQHIVVTTTPVGATAYVVGAGMSSVIERYSEGKLTSVTEPTSGTYECLRMLREHDSQFALCAAIAKYAYTGTAMFEEDGPVPNIRFLCNTHIASLWLLTHADSDINSMADLGGKSVSFGTQGSPVTTAMLDIAEEYGFDIEKDIDHQFIDLFSIFV